MVSGGWLKNIISSKKHGKVKSLKMQELSAPENTKGLNEETPSKKEPIANSIPNENTGALAVPIEDIAAIRIQSEFRAYKARKVFRLLKGTARLRNLTLGSSVSNHASNTLRHLHTWSRIQAEITARRMDMATEARIRQKKLENQLNLNVKLHDPEVEWSGGTETMEEVLSKFHLREAAAVKRERTMAYAFTHQWRANSNPVLGNSELGKAIWGWSWTERWIAARPWESRALLQSSPKKTVSRQSSKNGKNTKSPTMKPLSSLKSISPNGKGTIKARQLSYGAADQAATTNKEQIAC